MKYEKLIIWHTLKTGSAILHSDENFLDNISKLK